MSQAEHLQIEGQVGGAAGVPNPHSTWPYITKIGVIFVLAFATGYVFLFHGHQFFTRTKDLLPLLLPLVVTLLSIFTRAAEIRTLEGILKISNDIAIGIISFDIWAISVSKSDPKGRILVSAHEMIDGELVMTFLMFGLVTAVGCLVATNYNYKNYINKYLMLTGALLFSIVIYLIPFGQIQEIPADPRPPVVAAESHRYTVVIPYQDPAITKVAPAFLDDRYFASIFDGIVAPSKADAKEVAMKLFLNSSYSDQYKNKGADKVSPKQTKMVVCEE